jgi:anaerobic selenocysteine-containing dehydrogenase
LICLGGNPMSSWPDERKTEAALAKLELMVLIDVVMSATAKRSNYVIATPMSLEVPSTTYLTEYLKYLGVSRGWEIPWAQYVPAASKHPAGSDLIEEHAFFFRMAQRMGLQLNWVNYHGFGKFEQESPSKVIALNMTRIPTLDELWELTTCDSRIPLDEVKKHPHGHLFDIPVRVEPRAADCADMLQIGDSMMMAELAAVRAEDHELAFKDKEFPYRLISRRANHVMNSLLVGLPVAMRKRAYNPAFMHPADLEALGLSSGDVVSIRSRRDAVLGIVEGDETLRRGIISMTHGFGGHGREAESNPYTGTNVNLLIPEDEFDPISGIPRMSSIPVTIERKLPVDMIARQDAIAGCSLDRSGP